MFKGATSFNQPLGAWNVALVTDMAYVPPLIHVTRCSHLYRSHFSHPLCLAR